MQFTIPATAFMAFVSGVLAQVAGFDTITKPEKGEVVAAGETFTIVWEAAPAEYDDETVSIILLAGDSPTTLVPGEEPIAAGIVNSDGEYEWDVPATLGDDKAYGFRIQLDSDSEVFQYSFPFEIEAGEGVPSGSADPTASETASEDPKPTSSISANSTTKAPETTVTSTYVDEPTQEPTDEPEPEPSEPASGAATNGVMGTVALVGALAAGVFAF